MTLLDILRHSYWRSKKPEYWCGFRYEVKYALRQAEAAFYQRLHLLAETQVHQTTRERYREHDHFNREGEIIEHRAMDVPEMPDHMIVGCTCGREWS